MNEKERIRAIGRELSRLAFRADQLNAGSCRDALVARMEKLCIEHALLTASQA